MAGQLTGLHAKFTGDSSSFVKASTLATMALRKQEAEARKAKAAQDALAASGVGLSREFHKLKMETDSAYAGMVRFQKASELVRKVADSQQWSQEQLGAELSRLANHYGVAEAAGLSLNQQIRASRFHTANLAAQFNDIGVMMASGQSPFIMAIQQGTQLNQVLDNMGGTAGEKFEALVDSLLSLINPTSILTIGLIAGGSALYQWATSADEAAEKTQKLDDAVRTLTDVQAGMEASQEILSMSLTELIEKYGMYALAVRKAAEELLLLQVAEAEGALSSQIIDSAESFSHYAASMDAATASAQYLAAEEAALQGQMSYGAVVLSGAAAQTEQSIRNLMNELGVTRAEAIQLADAFARVQAAASIGDRIQAFTQLSYLVSNIGVDLNKLPPPIRAALIQAGELAIMMAKVKTAANEAKSAAVALGATGMGGLIGGLEAAIGKAGVLAAKLWAAAAAKARLGSDLAPGESPRPMPRGQGEVIDLQNEGSGGGSGGGGGGGGGPDPIVKELEDLQNSLKTKEELELESFQRRQEILEESLQKQLITKQDYADMMAQIEETYNFGMKQRTNEGVSSVLSSLGQLFQGSKKIGAGIALANSWLAFTEVLKDPSYVGRPWARFAAATSALASGLNAVRNIKSSSPGGGGSSSAGGGTGSGSSGGGQSYSQQVALQLVGGDMFSRDQVLKLINAINEASKDGARITVR